jgi:hypothetical protein
MCFDRVQCKRVPCEVKLRPMWDSQEWLSYSTRFGDAVFLGLYNPWPE